MFQTSPPPGVLHRAEEMRKTIGAEPTFEQLRAYRWRITFQNDRVKVTFDYRTCRRTERVGSELMVDGKPRRLARNLKHLGQIFNDTTAALDAQHVCVVAPESVDWRSAPFIVKHVYWILMLRAGRHDVEVRLSRTEAKGWRIGIYLEDGLVELNYSRRNGRWSQDAKRPLRLVIDNEDVTDDAGTWEEALKKLFDGSEAQPRGASQTGVARGVEGRSNSVVVRNTSVIRN